VCKWSKQVKVFLSMVMISYYILGRYAYLKLSKSSYIIPVQGSSVMFLHSNCFLCVIPLIHRWTKTAATTLHKSNVIATKYERCVASK
jgi:hypothetical protein